MTDDDARARATEYVLQQYHLSSLREAQERLTPRQFEGLAQEIAALQARIAAPVQPRPALQGGPPAHGAPGIDTPLGRVLPVTGLLLVAIWIVFALESLAPGGSTSTTVLVTYGATIPNVLATGQYWRLLTACFVHIGIVHIASNSLALLWLGGLAERFYGPVRYLGIYLAAGVAGNILSALIQPDIGAGASGAIFGILGAMLVAAWRNRGVIGAAASQQLFRSLAQLLVINIAISFLPGIGWAAHLGGALTGGVLALLIPFNSPRYAHGYALAANVLSAILIVATLALGVTWVGNHAVAL